tara:strand:- start:323 stop:697 length:375 start_codon:yes stop_codon:yes gene_type:complete
MIVTSLMTALISTMTPLELAIWKVETNQCLENCPEGEAGEIGPMQITYAAWSDVAKEGEKYEKCEELYYSVQIFRRYMERYAGPDRTGKIFTDEIGARIWNGGPNGWKKDSTKKYWKKVKRFLK